MLHNPKCTDCPLHATARSVCIPSDGPLDADVLIVGEAPGREEDRLNEPFVGKSGQLLNELLLEMGINRAQCRVTNSVRCHPPGNRKPTAKEIKACRRYFDAELKHIKPKFILTLGATALKAVLNQTGITSRRGRPQQIGTGPITFPTFHPATVFYDERYRPVLREDIRHFAKIIRTGKIQVEAGLNPIIVTNTKQLQEMYAALRGVVSLDLETTGLYPWAKGADITMLGFGTRDAQWLVVPNHPWSRDQMEDIVEECASRIDDCFVVTHNGKFDALWLRVHYGWTPELDFDTMLAHYLINENQLHDLEYLARLYFGAPAWDIPIISKQHITSENLKEVANYAAHDVYYTRNLFPVLNQRLRTDKQVAKLFDHVMMPLDNLYVRMEDEGCYVNVAGMAAAQRYLDEEIARRTAALKKYGDINWASPKQIGELMFGKLKIKPPILTKKGTPSTAEAALVQIEHDIVPELLALRGAKQEKAFFIDGWKPFIVNSRLHPNVKLHGTVTGRPSYEHPNFQQTTRETRIRSLICAPPDSDWVLMEADLSQIELRIAAEMSQDPGMMHAFRTGVDAHWLTGVTELARGGGAPEMVIKTASAITGKKIRDYSDAIKIILKAGPGACSKIDPGWKQVRHNAKATNFGYLYGMYPKKFRLYAKQTYNVDITMQQAEASRESFFSLYSGLPDWHERQKNYARSRGFVRAIDGQKRRLPIATSDEDTPERAEAFRQAINSPVQGFAAKINLMIMLQMCEEFPWRVYRPFATVHDAILSYVRSDYVERCAARTLEITRHPRLFDTLGIKLSVPLEGEIKIGPWGKGVPLEDWLQEQRAAA